LGRAELPNVATCSQRARFATALASRSIAVQSAVRVEEVIRNQDIGFVQSGQDAEIKVDTFNFTR
jgi:hypothetical protein